MKFIRQLDYESLVQMFAEENCEKDRWFPDKPEKDDWPRARLREANQAATGHWGEYELDKIDLARICLHWNKELEIPRTGIMMPEAITLLKVQEWLASDKPEKLSQNSHLWLSSNYIRHDSSGEMPPRDGLLYLLDGLHRSIFWFHRHRQSMPVLAFIAGKELT